MSLDIFQSVLTGSVGALAFLCIAVYALVNGIVHPDKAYQSQVERVKLLEGENSRLNGSIISLTEANTELRIELATLKSDMTYMRSRLDRYLEGSPS